MKGENNMGFNNASAGIRKIILKAIDKEGGLTITSIRDILMKNNNITLEKAASSARHAIRHAVDDGLLKKELDKQDGEQVIFYVLTPNGREWLVNNENKNQKKIETKHEVKTKEKDDVMDDVQFYIVEEDAKLNIDDLKAAKSYSSLKMATEEASRIINGGSAGASRLIIIQVHSLVSPAITSVVKQNPLSKQ